MTEKLENKIIKLIDDYMKNGLRITNNIEFPADTDKFVLDLAAMKISEGISEGLQEVANSIESLSGDMGDQK